MSTSLRPLRPEDGPALQQLERRAGERFREIGMDAVADDEPMSLATLAAYAVAGHGWVATSDDGDALGYVVVDVIDGCAHVEQISVDPDHQGIGVRPRAIDGDDVRDADALRSPGPMSEAAAQVQVTRRMKEIGDVSEYLVA